MIKRITEMNTINRNRQFPNIKDGKYLLGIEFSESKFIYFNKKRRDVVFSFFNMKPYTLKDKVKFLLVKICGKSFKFKNLDNTDVGGDCMMISRKNEVKVFDFDRAIVRTSYQKEILKKIRKNIAYFEGFYDLTIEEFNEDQNIIAEKLIIEKRMNNWTENDYRVVISSLVQSLLNKCIKYPKEKVISRSSNAFLDDCKLTKKRSEYILPKFILDESEKSMIWPEIVSHGDLNFNNILLYKEFVYLIDFEEVENRFFLYDFFDMFFMEALSYSNYIYISDYLLGVYTDQLTKIFKAFGMVYDSEDSFLYFKIFYICKIKNMQYVTDDEMFRKISLKYKNCYNAIESMYQSSNQ